MKKLLFLALMASVMFWGCNDDDDDNGDGGDGMGTLSVRLTDAAASYDSVFIDVQELHINVSTDEDTEDGWQELTLDTMGQIDLLMLTNGKDILLSEEELPTGDIGQMRLVLGPDNEIVVDGGERQPLATPSGQQSGLKFNINATLEEDVIYKMWLDFDVNKSIVAKGNGTYSLKPTIKVFTEESGSISGNIMPLEAEPLVQAVMGEDTTSTYADNGSGDFLIQGLDEGSYEVYIIPAEGYMADTLNVEVSYGSTSDIGEIELEMNSN